MRGFLLMALFVASLGGATPGTIGITGEPATTPDGAAGIGIDAAADRLASRETVAGEGLNSRVSGQVAGDDAEHDRAAERRTAL